MKDDYAPPVLVSSEMLLGSRQAAGELGIDISDALATHDIASKQLVSPEGFLTRAQVIGFLETVAERFNCHHFGLLVGWHQPPMRLGRLTPIFTLSADIRSAIENTLTYQPLYSEARVHSLVVEEGFANLVRRDPQLAAGGATQLNTLVIVQMYKILRALSGGDWKASSVSFSHTAPAEKPQYERLFGCPVYFEREFDGITFPEHHLAEQISTANPELLDIVLAHYDDLMAAREHEHDMGDIVAAVSAYIHRKLGSNLCNLPSCARFLDLHPRTLQRELAERGSTFKELLTDIRMEQAQHYLRNSTMPLVELAEMLGYRNPSAFTRAFNNGHGLSPLAWRKANSR